MAITSRGIKFVSQSKRGLFVLIVLTLVKFTFTIFLLISLSANILFPEKIQAAVGVSKILSYQGRLTDTSGTPLGGLYCFRFSIYDVQSGGNKLWPAGVTPPNTNTVNVVNGIFNVGIGEADNLNTFNFYSSNSPYLNIEVAEQVSSSCTNVSFEPLSPRQRIDAAAYARVTRDVYGDLLRTDNTNNLVQIGTGSGSATPVPLGLDVKNTPESAGDSCSVQGTVWYNSAQSKAFICTGIPAKLQEISNEAIQGAGVQGFGVSNLGNTLGVTGTGTGTVVLVGGANITLSQATDAVGRTITILGETAGGGGGGIGAISAGASQATNGTVVFSNANNVSFGMDAGQVITASFAGGAGGGSYNILAAGSQTANTTGTVLFSNANGLSFGMDNSSVITGSYTVPAQSTQTQNMHGLVVSNNTFGATTIGTSGSVSFAGTNITITANTANNSIIGFSVAAPGAAAENNWVTLGGNVLGNSSASGSTINWIGGNNITLSGLNNSQIRIDAGGGAGSYNILAAGSQTANTTGTVLFANSNNITFGMSNNSVVTASASLNQSVQTQNMVSVQGSTGNISFSNSNNITFGFNASVVTASASLNQSTQPVALSGSNGSFNFSTATFGNLNGFSFYTTNGSMVGSYTVPTQLAGSYNILAAGSQTANTSGSVLFSDANNVSFGMNNSSVITASIPAIPSAYVASLNASTGQLSISGGNNITVGNNASTITISAPNQSVQTQNMVSVQGSTGDISFSNSNNITFGFNASVVTASASFNQSAQPVALSGSNGSFAFSTATFGNLNGLSFYTSNGSMVGSYTVPSQSAEPRVVSLNASTGELSISGGNNITVGNNASTITISAANQTVQPVALSGSNGSFNFSTATFGNLNGLSFYTSNGSMVGSYTVPSQSTGSYNILAAGSQTANTSGSVLFADANGLSFGMNNSSVITGSYTVPTQSVQTQNMVSVQGSTGDISFSNSNNVSFGFNASVVTASASFNQSAQPVALSGSNGSFAFSTATFGNSNGLSFYTTNGSMVGSYTVPTQSAEPRVVSLNGTSGSISLYGASNVSVSNNASAITLYGPIFSNSNNVTFGVNGQTITASASVAQSTQPVALSGSNGSFAFSTATFGNSNGLSFYTTNGSMVGSYTVPAAQTGISGIAGSGASTVTNGTVVFSNLNNVSFGLAGSTMTASIPAIPSAYVVSLNGSTGQLSISGGNNITVGNNAYTITISAANQTTQPGPAGIAGSGASTLTDGTLVFSNLNNVSFGLAGSTMTASIPAGATATGNLGGIAGSAASTVTGGTLVFSNLNNVSFGLNVSTMTASIPAGATATGNFGGLAASNVASTFTSGTVQFSAGNLISIGTAAGPAIVISNLLSSSATAADVTTATNAGTLSSRFALADHAHRGVRAYVVSGIASTFFGDQVLSAGSLMALSTGGNTTAGSVAIHNLLSSATTVSGVGTTNVIGAMASRFALEGHQHAGVPVAGISGAGAGGSTSGTSGTYYGSLMFAAGNNITLSAVTGAGGQTITISAGAGGGGVAISANAANGSTNFTSGTVTFAAGNTNITLSSGNQGISIYGPSPSAANLAISAAGTSQNAGTIVWSNSNNVSFGMNNSIITATATFAGGGAPTLSRWANFVQAIGRSDTITLGWPTQGTSAGSLFIFPLVANGGIFPGNMTVNTFLIGMSGGLSAVTASTAAKTYGVSIGLYTVSASSTLNLLNSAYTTFGTGAAYSAQSASYYGPRLLSINSSVWSGGSLTLSQRDYYLGYWISSTGESFGLSWMGIGGKSGQMSGTMGASNATATSMGYNPFFGMMSVTTNAMPATINRNVLVKTAVGQLYIPYIYLENEVSKF